MHYGDSLVIVGLEILIESGTPEQSAHAKKIAPVRKKVGSLLVDLTHLCTDADMCKCVERVES